MHSAAPIASRYLRFAEQEAHGRSPLYEAIARGVAGDVDMLGFLATLPPAKQQPNLLLAAVRAVAGIAADWPSFRDSVRTNVEAVRRIMLSRSTQTNEPARCATLLPLLAQLPQPLALIEVGASAGLCLLPDFYAYRFGDHILRPEGAKPETPVFACAASRSTPLPEELPQIAWRVGLDLNPLDCTNPEQTDWLEALVWPEQAERLTNLRAALAIAARVRPRVEQGDLRGDALERLCRQAPQGATLVCFHTAVLAYIADATERDAFARRIMALCPYWISNEAPHISGDKQSAAPAGRFLLSLNGAPVAWTDPHGAALEWLP